MANICIGKKYEIGTRVPYRVYVTDQTDTANAAVYVMLEYNADQIAPLLNTFVKDGIMPGGLVLFVNPGSVALPRQADRRRTYAVINVENGKASAHIEDVELRIYD